MNTLFNQNISEIIAEAAKSRLGILALMIIILSILAYYFFRNAPNKYKFIVFIFLFSGVFLFGYVVTKSDIKGSNQTEDIIATIENVGLYRDEYEGETWAEYDPKINGQKRFWIGVKIKANQNLTIQTFAIGHLEFHTFYIGYSPQTYTHGLTLFSGQSEWVAIPVELNDWQKYAKILSHETPLKLIGRDGKIVASSSIIKDFGF
ncbi:MAG: hypothetical protein AABY84_10455 [Candidatus Firestonebacteria bacterium]